MTHNDAFAARIMLFINKLLFFEKKGVLTYEGIKLYPSEIHLLEVIAQHPGLNATSIAATLGVTKGAVSQTLSRLHKKGIVYKTKAPSKNNELTVHFTETGQGALEAHQQRHASLSHEYAQYLSTLSETEKTTIKDFLAFMDHFLEMLH